MAVVERPKSQSTQRREARTQTPSLAETCPWTTLALIFGTALMAFVLGTFVPLLL